MAINFFQEETTFNLKERNKRKRWLRELAAQKKHKIGELNYVICSDEYLHSINVEYLDHDTYTDIITFDNSEEEGIIEGDIFISIDRVIDNSKNLSTPLNQELNRVLSHGLLHLLGYKDKTKEEELEMRNQEDSAIQLFEKL